MNYQLFTGPYAVSKCLQCGSPMPIRESKDNRPLGSINLYYMDKAAIFCTLRCAAAYGIAQARAAHGFKDRASKQ